MEYLEIGEIDIPVYGEVASAVQQATKGSSLTKYILYGLLIFIGIVIIRGIYLANKEEKPISE